MSRHELEYHDDQDDEYSLYHHHPPTACVIPIPIAQPEFPCRTYSGDSSSADDQNAIILTTHSGSSDSQTNDSLYENAASAMTSYVASLPPVLKQNNSNDIHIDTEQRAQSEMLRSPKVADGIGVPICCTSEAVCGMTTTVVVWNDLELPLFVPSVTLSATFLSGVAGGVLCGPMGFICGASAIGLVAGYGQIPAEYRDQLCSIFGKKQLSHLTHVAHQTTKTASDIFSRAWRGTELFSSECSSQTHDEYYHHIGRTQTIYGKWNAFKICIGGIFNACDQFDEDDQLVSPQLEDLNTIFDALNLFCSKHQLRKDVKVDLIRKEKELRITAPLNKIHSLPLHLHAVAWMGIISSNYRSIEEKHEALQEILMLVKDKNYAKKMLDQGILDSFLSILSDFFYTLSKWVRQQLRQRCYTNMGKTEQESRFQIHHTNLKDKNIRMTHNSASILEKTICELYPVALLTSRCCVALGKANCSSIIGTNDTVVKAAHCCPSRVIGVSNSRENMEFDSIYDLVSNISIPSWQKLARLLYEYPHHLRILQEEEEEENTEQPLQKHKEPELFVSVKWSVLEAQDIARLINCLATGTLDPRLVSSDPERLIRVLSERLANLGSK